jgi:quinolinate synthase
MIKENWINKGFVDEPIDTNLDLKKEIRKMAKEKNAIICVHYYTPNDVQDIADYIGDSLALAQKASTTDAKIIVMCGVHFMAETDKIICPDKKVLCPDLNAGCTLADSCKAGDLKKYKEEHPGYKVISYVNTTAAVKSLTDIVVTSGNARKIIDSLPKNEKIIFGPDYNLGSYINSQTGRNMLLWNGGCNVHERFSVERILEIKKTHPNSLILAHPECKGPVLAIADFVGSTAAILKYASESQANSFIVATEAGILHQMRNIMPSKEFIPAPPEDNVCGCNECSFMKLNTLEKVYNCLKYEWPEVVVDENIAKKAIRPIKRMLELS